MMFKSRLKPLILIALLSCVLSPVSGFAAVENPTTTDSETEQTTPDGYIKDDLFIYVHTGSSKKFKILGSINAGTPLQMLDSNEETGFIQIKDDRGRIGWIEQSSYTTEPGNLIKLQALQQQFDQLNASTQYSESSIDDLTIKLQAAQDVNESLTQKIAVLEKEKTELQSEMSKSNTKDKLNQWIYGASIVVVGILLGLLMPSLARRRRRNEYL